MIIPDVVHTLSEVDTDALLSMNSAHAPFWDYFMSAFTGKLIWVPMYASILYVLIVNFHWKAVVAYVVAIALIITFADKLSVEVIRPIVMRLRPANPDNPIAHLVHIVDGYRGGAYGFPSSHAANSFGLALFVAFLFRRHKLVFFIFFWALMNCYTRIYLGVHYPGDLLMGLIIGAFFGWIFTFVVYKLLNRYLKPYVCHLRRPEMKHPLMPIYVGTLTIAGISVYAGMSSLGWI
ncbi:MAG: phosphatase PAP2 family protein [Mediterranea sp.]|jgi:undecaprenyl-diphosphatase|nr:phosphatase PAP2 family protein [Mediterranea sp.]